MLAELGAEIRNFVFLNINLRGGEDDDFREAYHPSATPHYSSHLARDMHFKYNDPQPAARKLLLRSSRKSISIAHQNINL
jgi:hypothetical protein